MTGFTYKSYSFVDKDPIIDEVRSVFQDAGVTKQWVEDHSGVTSTTLHNWFDGKTRKPQPSMRCFVRSAKSSVSWILRPPAQSSK
jgi:hypothetical protein